MLKFILKNYMHIIIGTLILVSGIVFNPLNHYLFGFVVMMMAVVLYFYIVIKVADRNWLDIRAVFSGVWFFTIGMASLRLLDYQEQWQVMTWVNNAVAFAMFQVGADYGKVLWKKIYKIVSNIDLKIITFKLHENRLFSLCVGTTIISILCLFKNVQIRGYVPFFSNDPNAYINFHTVFNLFSIASIVISSLCYYCLKTQRLSLWRKVMLVLCILYATFIYPILILSRGIFVTACLILATTIFYLHNKKFWVLVSSIVLIFGIYVSLSSFRGYTDAQLDYFFEPSEITISNESIVNTDDGTKENISLESVTEKEDVVEESTEEPMSEDDNKIVFSLPAKVAFVYSYLTVSHDNFNEAVENSIECSYGLRQLRPINVKPFNMILDLSAIEKVTTEGEYYQVRPHLTTVNLIGEFYYDLHILGVAVFMLLWGMIFSMIQARCESMKVPFAIMELGITMTPVVLCFFASWTSNFQQWVLWGTGWILWFIACIEIKKNSGE